MTAGASSGDVGDRRRGASAVNARRVDDARRRAGEQHDRRRGRAESSRPRRVPCRDIVGVVKSSRAPALLEHGRGPAPPCRPCRAAPRRRRCAGCRGTRRSSARRCRRESRRDRRARRRRRAATPRPGRPRRRARRRSSSRRRAVRRTSSIAGRSGHRRATPAIRAAKFGMPRDYRPGAGTQGRHCGLRVPVGPRARAGSRCPDWRSRARCSGGAADDSSDADVRSVAVTDGRCSRLASPCGTEGRRHRSGVLAARHGRQDAQARPTTRARPSSSPGSRRPSPVVERPNASRSVRAARRFGSSTSPISW